MRGDASIANSSNRGIIISLRPFPLASDIQVPSCYAALVIIYTLSTCTQYSSCNVACLPYHFIRQPQASRNLVSRLLQDKSDHTAHVAERVTM